MSETRTLVDEQGRTMCDRCEVARSMFSRMRGLLGRRGLEAGHGMLITHTGSVHMFFMRFPIDVVFLGRDLTVRKIVRNLRPWRMAASFGARNALELPAGEAERVGFEVGARLSWREDRRPGDVA